MNLPIPPRWLRRILIAPLVMVTAFWILITLPLLAIAAAAVSPFLPGSWRALRLLAFGLVYLVMELAGLLAALALWVGSGFGAKLHSPRFIDLHYELLGWALRFLVTAAERLFSLEIVEEPGRDIRTIAGRPNPLVLLSRHAGPGDSFLLAHEIMSVAQRRPRIVLKDTLQLDPFIDVMLNRLPNRFISPTPGEADHPVRAISELASTMGPRDALLIFPEGGNFTEARRIRAIERLRSRGNVEGARRAQALTYVLPPRPAGALAALDACPTADAVFVAHTGLDDLDSVSDLWHAIPEDNTLTVSWRGVTRDAIPNGPDRAGWLQDAWADIDTWVGAHRADKSD